MRSRNSSTESGPATAQLWSRRRRRVGMAAKQQRSRRVPEDLVGLGVGQAECVLDPRLQAALTVWVAEGSAKDLDGFESGSRGRAERSSLPASAPGLTQAIVVFGMFC